MSKDDATGAPVRGEASEIIRLTCNQRRNSDIRADDRELVRRLDLRMEELKQQRDSAHAELAAERRRFDFLVRKLDFGKFCEEAPHPTLSTSQVRATPDEWRAAIDKILESGNGR